MPTCLGEWLHQAAPWPTSTPPDGSVLKAPSDPSSVLRLRSFPTEATQWGLGTKTRRTAVWCRVLGAHSQLSAGCGAGGRAQRDNHSRAGTPAAGASQGATGPGTPGPELSSAEKRRPQGRCLPAQAQGQSCGCGLVKPLSGALGVRSRALEGGRSTPKAQEKAEAGTFFFCFYYENKTNAPGEGSMITRNIKSTFYHFYSVVLRPALQ